MSSTDALRKRVDRMIAALEQQRNPRPRLINCTGAKAALLAHLEVMTERDQDAESDEQLPALVDEQFAGQFKAVLAHAVDEIERRHNVRFISEDTAA